MTVTCATNNCISPIILDSFEETLQPSDIYAMRVTPYVPAKLMAKGANTAIIIFEWSLSKDFLTTQYTGGGNIQLLYAGTAINAGTVMSPVNITNAVDSYMRVNFGLSGSSLLADIVNKDVVLTNLTAAFAAGDSPIKIGGIFGVIDLTGLL